MTQTDLLPVLSHGTTETKDLVATRAFFEQFLGLEIIQPLPFAMYAGAGGPWKVVCVHTGLKLREQTRDNRFCLEVKSPASVTQAHARALAEQERWNIRTVDPITANDGGISFALQDMNYAWWEIFYREDR